MLSCTDPSLDRRRVLPAVHLWNFTCHLVDGSLNFPPFLLLQLNHWRHWFCMAPHWRANSHLVGLYRHFFIWDLTLTVNYSFISVLVRATELLGHRKPRDLQCFWGFLKLHFVNWRWSLYRCLNLQLVKTFLLHQSVREVSYHIIFLWTAPNFSEFIVKVPETNLWAVRLPSPNRVVNLDFRCF